MKIPYFLLPIIFCMQSMGIAQNGPAKVYPKFEAQTIDDQVKIGYGLAIGDVDGDGKPDIILADKDAFVWYRNGDWKRFVLIENLTAWDNVCVTARDITGDGKVEIAVGAQWNPIETLDAEKSGSVHYLLRPKDPTQPWEAIQLHHEPTTHRMGWVKVFDEGLGKEKYQLIVVPLHGRGNRNGVGAGVKVYAYDIPENPRDEWKLTLIDSTMHMTHNFEIFEGEGKSEMFLLGGKEGAKLFGYQNGKWEQVEKDPWEGLVEGSGEIRLAGMDDRQLVTTIEPMHGDKVVIYNAKNNARQVLEEKFNQGHALAITDVLGNGYPQIIAGWRDPNEDEKIGIKMYYPANASMSIWNGVFIDENTMATEDLKVADLDGDGKPDIIAAGRSTNNLKVYWNKSE